MHYSWTGQPHRADAGGCGDAAKSSGSREEARLTGPLLRLERGAMHVRTMPLQACLLPVQGTTGGPPAGRAQGKGGESSGIMDSDRQLGWLNSQYLVLG